MYRIYRKAHSVICWLGPAYHKSTRFLDLVLSVDQIEYATQASQRNMILHALRDDTFDFRQTYMNFFTRAYWYRTWITQETFFANPAELYIQCGKRKVSWDALVAFQKVVSYEFCGTKSKKELTKSHVGYAKVESPLKSWISVSHRLAGLWTCHCYVTRNGKGTNLRWTR